MARRPTVNIAEVTFKCPDGTRVFSFPGPTASLAIQKALRFDASSPGAPKFLSMRCRKVGVQLVQRGSAAALGRARKRRRR
jgi:hypothetical protein